MRRRRTASPEERLLRQVAKNFQHSRERLGKLRVQCEVSDRFLAFPDTSAVLKDGRDLMIIGVMTSSAEGDTKRLCELILDRKDVLEAISRVKATPFGSSWDSREE